MVLENLFFPLIEYIHSNFILHKYSTNNIRILSVEIICYWEKWIFYESFMYTYKMVEER